MSRVVIDMVHEFHIIYILGHQSKKEGKDQESIQLSTTPDPRHHIGK